MFGWWLVVIWCCIKYSISFMFLEICVLLGLNELRVWVCFGINVEWCYFVERIWGVYGLDLLLWLLLYVRIRIRGWFCLLGFVF